MSSLFHLFRDIPDTFKAIVYTPAYNISFFGLERLHPFDSSKWGRTYQMLLDAEILTQDETPAPEKATDEDLLRVHSQKYLNSLKWSAVVAKIVEIPPVLFLPNSVVQKRVLDPLRYQVGGTVLAGKLALERGAAVNLGGGFHHCSAADDDGGGFCPYADLTLCIRALREAKLVDRVMIIDLDAHQGNGHARDFMDEKSNTFVLDVYNTEIYPQDRWAKRGISRDLPVRSGIRDAEYLNLLRDNIPAALDDFQPQLIVYNAGTDILDNDPLGGMCVSAEGVIARDELVFSEARRRNIPIIMVTSGGYQRVTARVIADSLINLNAKGLLKEESTTLATDDTL